MNSQLVALVRRVAFLAVTLATTASDAAIKTPDCAALEQWGKSIDDKDRWALNTTNPQLWLPGIFRGSSFEETYGKAPLDVTPPEIAEADKVIVACGGAAQRARRTEDLRALQALRTMVAQRLSYVVQTTAAAELRFDKGLAELSALPPSRDQLRALAALRLANPVSDASLREAGAALQGVRPPAAPAASAILAALRDLPSGRPESRLATLDARIEPSRVAVLAQTTAAINALPETVEGLRAIAPALASAKTELGKALAPADIATLDQAAEARRNAIEDGLVTRESARLDALPANVQTLAQLRTMQVGAGLLSPQRTAAVNALIAARRDAIAGNLITDEIKQLDTFPGTLAGLRQFNERQRATYASLGNLIGLQATDRYRQAIEQRLATLAPDAFDEFRQAIAALPMNAAGMAELERSMAEIDALLPRMPAASRTGYVELALQKREQLLAAIKAEEARLESLPLEGSVYADADAAFKLEFRNRTRGYLTTFGTQTIEVEYEQDGNRVILRGTPQGNIVMTREGGALSGSGVTLRRLASK